MSTTQPHRLDCLFQPRSIAVVGASSDPSKIGGRPIAYMRRAGFKGPLYPINPQQSEVQGVKAYPSLAAIGAPVDQVIIALPGAHVPAAIDEALAHQAGSIIVFSAGFAEAGEQGARVQDALAARCRAAGVPLVGPNCIGVFSVASGVCATFVTALEHEMFEPGHVGIVSQSGAIGSYLYGMAADRGLRFSRFVATGNESDVDAADCIDWMAQDDETRVILVYLEGARDGERLRRALQRARAQRKPVILMKVGRSAQGAAAAASHTGTLAGADEVYDAVLCDSQAWRADTLEEMIDLAYACSTSPLPRGNRLGVVTPSGGAGVICADEAARSGLVLPLLPDALQDRIRALIPLATPVNPVDTTAQTVGDRSLYTRILGHVVGHEGYDIVLSFNSNVGRTEAEFSKIREALYALRRDFPQRVLAISMRARPEIAEELRRNGILYFADPSRATATLGAMARIAQGFETAGATAAPVLPATAALPAGTLDEAVARRLLEAHGIPFAPQRAVTTAQDAVAAGRDLGYPAVMKVLSPDIAHKSEVSGVLLGLAGDEQMDAGWTQLMARVRAAAPAARIEGAIVSPMISGGVETVMGVVRDPVFGPMLMFGLGGVFVEVFKDVVFRPAPVDLQTAREMVREIRGLPLLQGARGRPPADLDTLARALVDLSTFAVAHAGEVDSVEINPFIALPEGGCAVDALILKRPGTH